MRGQDRQAYGSSPEPVSPDVEPAIEDAKGDTENLQAFFHNLINNRRGGTK